MSLKSLAKIKDSSCDICGKLMNKQFLLEQNNRKYCSVCFYKLYEDRIKKRVPQK